MIKGTKTIAQYKIMKWVQDQFESESSLTVIFVNPDTALLLDNEGGKLEITYDPEIGIVVMG